MQGNVAFQRVGQEEESLPTHPSPHQTQPNQRSHPHHQQQQENHDANGTGYDFPFLNGDARHQHDSYPTPSSSAASGWHPVGQQEMHDESGSFATVSLVSPPRRTFDATDDAGHDYASIQMASHSSGKSYVPLPQSTDASQRFQQRPPPPSPISPPVPLNTPFHSYPHLNFTLPLSFVMPTLTTHTHGSSSNGMNGTMQYPNGHSSSSEGSMPNGSAMAASSVAGVSAPAAATPAPISSSSSSSSIRYRVSFRALHPSDLDSVRVLHDICFPVKYDRRFYLELFNTDKVSLLAFLETVDPQSSPSPVCSSPSLLIGVATGRIRDRGGGCGDGGDATHRSSSCRRQPASGYIITLGVRPEFRKIGLGTFLLRHVIRLMREADRQCECIQLHVKDGNTAALRMYESFGFHHSERLDDHYLIEGRHYTAFKLVKFVDPNGSIYDDSAATPSWRWVNWCNLM